MEPILVTQSLFKKRSNRLQRHRHEIADAFGTFIAGLAPWDWFINPITFRDRAPAAESRLVQVTHRDSGVSFCEADPRIALWKPFRRGVCPSGPPVPAQAMARIWDFLAAIQEEAGQPIGWVVAEEFGRAGGRYHCHALVTGVAHLRRDKWWEEAFKRFGRTRIVPFDPARGAAFYAAKYAAKQLGGIHFGGRLGGVDLAAFENRQPQAGGGVEVVRSAPMPKAFFRMTLPRWHR